MNPTTPTKQDDNIPRFIPLKEVVHQVDQHLKDLGYKFYVDFGTITNFTVQQNEVKEYVYETHLSNLLRAVTNLYNNGYVFPSRALQNAVMLMPCPENMIDELITRGVEKIRRIEEQAAKYQSLTNSKGSKAKP